MESSNASSSGTIELPNPLTPMAFLPPEVAYQIGIASYVVVGSMGVFAWDILDNLGDDYLLLFRYPIRAPTIAYFISRLGSLCFVLIATLFETAPIGHCTTLEYAADWVYPVAVSSTALLFFFRVRAVFDHNVIAVAFFGFMWLAVLAGSLTPIRSVVGMNIGPTDYCIISVVKPYVAAGAIIPLVNDTLVFLAITWRLMDFADADRSIRTGFRAMAFGDYMPALSRALLQDGQAYYLATVSTSLMTVVMLYLKSVPPVYRTMFTVTNITVMNVMASRVFRNTKFGLFREKETPSRGVMLMPIDTRNKPRRDSPSGTLSVTSMHFKTPDPRSHAMETVMELEDSSDFDHEEDRSPGKATVGMDDVV